MAALATIACAPNEAEIRSMVRDELAASIIPGPPGPAGPQGERGPQGIRGERGPQGERGIAGEAHTYAAALGHGNLFAPSGRSAGTARKAQSRPRNRTVAFRRAPARRKPRGNMFRAMTR